MLAIFGSYALAYALLEWGRTPYASIPQHAVKPYFEGASALGR